MDTKPESPQEGEQPMTEATTKLESNSASSTNDSESLPDAQPQQPAKQEISALVDKEVIDLEEKRRREVFGQMDKIEKEFADLKEKFFQEKIEALEKELEAIRAGTSQSFLKKCKDLEEIKEHKIWAAERWREYQLQNIESIFQSEQKQAEDEYKADKKLLKERMLNSTADKRKKLFEEKSTMTLAEPGDSRLKRNLRNRKGASKESKDQGNLKRRINPPHINYILKDSEILEDLSLIQKAHPTYGKWGKSSLEVYTDRGRLYYHSQVFEKGKDVFIEAKNENGKWHGTLVMVSPSEIHIRSPTDGTKSRFSLAQLRSGRYTLTPIT